MRCGTDIIKVDRVKNAIEELGEKFLKRVYTDAEINYCESRQIGKFESYSARFAAKEAVFKALAPSRLEGGVFTEVEVKNDETGKPYIVLHGELLKLNKNKNIDISLSHEKDYAIAMCVIED